MGGDHSQKLQPWRGTLLLSGAQTSGSLRIQHCSGNHGRNLAACHHPANMAMPQLQTAWVIFGKPRWVSSGARRRPDHAARDPRTRQLAEQAPGVVEWTAPLRVLCGAWCMPMRRRGDAGVLITSAGMRRRGVGLCARASRFRRRQSKNRWSGTCEERGEEWLAVRSGSRWIAPVRWKRSRHWSSGLAMMASPARSQFVSVHRAR